MYPLAVKRRKMNWLRFICTGSLPFAVEVGSE